jgi:hypothetical protein
VESLITAVEAVAPATDDLVARVEALEGEVEELKQRLDSLLGPIWETKSDGKTSNWCGGASAGIAQKAWLPRTHRGKQLDASGRMVSGA